VKRRYTSGSGKGTAKGKSVEKNRVPIHWLFLKPVRWVHDAFDTTEET
jgi:hypothetical protein